MNRRQFLGGLAASTAIVPLAPALPLRLAPELPPVAIMTAQTFVWREISPELLCEFYDQLFEVRRELQSPGYFG